MIGLETFLKITQTVNQNNPIFNINKQLRRLVFGGLLTLASGANLLHAQYSALYVFGDSLSDLGNTYQSLSTLLTDELIYDLAGYTNHPGRYDNGRFSNGPLWVEQLNQRLGLSPLQSNNGSQTIGSGNTNFAYAAAVSGETSGGALDLFVNHLQKQVSDYRTLTGNASSSTALYTVWAGGNDLINYMNADTPSSDPSDLNNLVNSTVTNIGTAINNLYIDGARNFLVPNLPALGNKPNFVNTPKQSLANQLIDLFNQALESYLDNLSLSLLDIELYYLDVHEITDDIFANPANYGITNVTDAAYDGSGSYPGTVVSNPDDYLFWDNTHPGTKIHTLLGDIAYNAIVPEPALIGFLVGGVFVAIGLRRRIHRL